MDFMDFSFSNSTYTALLALFAAIFGVGYPLIIQAIGEIDKKYDSTLLLKCFEEEPDFKRFNKRVLTAQLQISVAFFCSIGLYFLV